MTINAMVSIGWKNKGAYSQRAAPVTPPEFHDNNSETAIQSSNSSLFPPGKFRIDPNHTTHRKESKIKGLRRVSQLNGDELRR